MKTKLLMAMTVVMAVALTCFARLERWPITQKPAISLAQAEAIGDRAVQEKHKDFFCIGARFSMLGEKAQEWELSYTNVKGDRKWAIIDGEGKSQLLDNPRDL